MSCKTCKWLKVEPNKGGKRVVRKDKAYQCGVPIERPHFPTSVLRVYNFTWPPHKTWLTAEMRDEVCLLWEERT